MRTVTGTAPINSRSWLPNEVGAVRGRHQTSPIAERSARLMSGPRPRSVEGTARWYWWGAFGVLLWTYVLFPIILIIRATFFPRPIRSAGDSLPSVTLIIAAHDEEQVIGAKLENLKRLDYPAGSLDLIIVSDGSTDRTDAIVEGAEGPRLLRIPWSGKAAAVEAGVRVARGEILVFTDANSMFRSDALRALVRPFADPAVGGVAGDQRYVVAAEGAHSLGELGYWRFDRVLKTAESLAGSVVGATGAIYAIRRSLFRPIPAGVNDDYWLSAGVVDQGHRLVFAADAISDEPVAAELGHEFSRKVRVMSRAFRTEVALRNLFDPRRHGFFSLQILSHKLLRRAGVIPLAIIFASSLAAWPRGIIYRVAASGQAGVLALGLIGLSGRVSHPLFSVPAYLVAANAASIVALFNLVRRQRIERWRHSRGPSRVLESSR